MVILSTSKTVFRSFCLYYTGCAYKTPYAVCSEFLPLSVKIGHKKKRQHSVCYTVCFFALANRLFLRMDFSNILMRSSRYKSSLILTDKGNEVGKKIADKIEYFLKEISCELTEEERLQFYHSLSVISKGLDNIANKKVKGARNLLLQNRRLELKK